MRCLFCGGRMLKPSAPYVFEQHQTTRSICGQCSSVRTEHKDFQNMTGNEIWTRRRTIIVKDGKKIFDPREDSNDFVKGGNEEWAKNQK